MEVRALTKTDRSYLGMCTYRNRLNIPNIPRNRPRNVHVPSSTALNVSSVDMCKYQDNFERINLHILTQFHHPQKDAGKFCDTSSISKFFICLSQWHLCSSTLDVYALDSDWTILSLIIKLFTKFFPTKIAWFNQKNLR